MRQNILRKLLKLFLPAGIKKMLLIYVWNPADLKKRYPKSFIGSPITANPLYLELEDNTRIHDEFMLISCEGKVVIKKYSEISVRACFVPGSHIPLVGHPQCLSGLHINDTSSTIMIEEDCWVGAEVMFLQKAHLGRGCVVGANSTITNSIPPYAVVAGTPAKIIAVRFSIDQILEHESLLYPENEQYSRSKLQEIFNTYFKDMRVIGVSNISEEDAKSLSEARISLGLAH